MQLKLLLVEDSPADSELLLRHLKKAALDVDYQRVETKEALLAALSQKKWDAIICDYNLPQLNAAEALTVLKDSGYRLPFIVVSGSIGEERAVAMMKAGANDYLMKDNLTRLVPVLQRELKEAKNYEEKLHAEEALRVSEANLRQSQKLESIGQLAGGIAHDFNNILATIFLQSELINQSLDKDLPPEQLADRVKKGVAQILKSSERATNLTRQLLAFSRKQSMQPQVLNLNGVISDMQQMLLRVVEAHIGFTVNLSDNLKNIKIDPGHLEQILVNLVVNSRDAMPKGGNLKIETENAHLDEDTAKTHGAAAGSYVLLTVSDTGTGISDDVKKRLFEPFFTTKPAGKGTGLGLATVYGIVKQNGGIIGVESELGHGSSFKIFFPVTEDQIQESRPVKDVGDLTGTETILVIEDDEHLKNLLSETLRKNGYTVLTASHGPEALDTLHPGQNVHLVITDLIMPYMSGTQLAQKIEATNKNCRILFQSGYSMESLDPAMLDQDTIHFLQKPYTMKVLLNEIRKILN